MMAPNTLPVIALLFSSAAAHGRKERHQSA
jgi:hypothetical protein